MKVFTTISELRNELKLCKDSLAIVPTMGALHAGHMSLVEIAKSKATKTGVSIFVNPTQFNNQSDLTSYPRDLQKDLALLEAACVDYVFTPLEDEVYRLYNGTSVSPSALAKVMEGPGRPGHFQGVCTVVSILFGIFKPEFAVFGEKDFQQLRIIEDMVRDLKFDIEIVRAPISREESGLARSSRNERLSKDDRDKVKIIFESLNFARKMVLDGVISPMEIISHSMQILEQLPELSTEYLSINYEDTLEEVEMLDISMKSRIFFAGQIGAVRLIDNMALSN
jgi:pantoate--beta-alanine ligase